MAHSIRNLENIVPASPASPAAFASHTGSTSSRASSIPRSHSSSSQEVEDHVYQVRRPEDQDVQGGNIATCNTNAAGASARDIHSSDSDAKQFGFWRHCGLCALVLSAVFIIAVGCGGPGNFNFLAKNKFFFSDSEPSDPQSSSKKQRLDGRQMGTDGDQTANSEGAANNPTMTMSQQLLLDSKKYADGNRGGIGEADVESESPSKKSKSRMQQIILLSLTCVILLHIVYLNSEEMAPYSSDASIENDEMLALDCGIAVCISLAGWMCCWLCRRKNEIGNRREPGDGV